MKRMRVLIFFLLLLAATAAAGLLGSVVSAANHANHADAITSNVQHEGYVHGHVMPSAHDFGTESILTLPGRAIDLVPEIGLREMRADYLRALARAGAFKSNAGSIVLNGFTYCLDSGCQVNWVEIGSPCSGGTSPCYGTDCRISTCWCSWGRWIPV